MEATSTFSKASGACTRILRRIFICSAMWLYSRTAVTHYCTARRIREMCENCKSLFERQNNTNIKELSQLKNVKPQDLSKSTAVI
jgi:hypothetical protein